MTAETSTPSSGRTVFLGCGSMNEAVLAGLLAGGTDVRTVTATVRRSERAEELRGRYPGLTVLAESEDAEANTKAVQGARLVVLGVKPAGIAQLCREVSGALAPDTVVVSVAAAITVATMEAALPAGQPLVRSMPNTPLKVGRGAVGISAGTHAGTEQLKLAEELFSGAGTVVVVPEDQLDAVSAVSGSGPAYAFYLAEAMANAGVELGLEPGLALALARQTVAGAGAMLAEEGADPAALRKAVTSPNGTTERAIAVFDEAGLPAVIAAGARAAADRAAQLSKELA
ncbi:pyrroline-5-carboxylate reductase [Arthrobacter crystallopoietes BAB-32]|uniref:Pyrroline-5-carboxylate reductase n=1 Tax=Arthrobacter crystallopoietes BAB-32 TaxID=1246476 RepID=N1V3E0_9MICC|nr:pyrroline-5-carboxylate reductase [Arthrobacter crystallopoietes]EMY34534.1 pyrroline-5-carboxylate reductase [Arthrobacter crystallopoietes BAB-32]